MYINVDNGGTFTDFWAFDTERKFRVKTRTTPHDLSECLFEGLRLLSEDIYRTPDLGKLLSETKYIRYSTTQGTNALVQRKGPRIGLVLPDLKIVEEMRTDGEATQMLDALVGERTVVMDPQELTAAERDDETMAQKVLHAVNKLTSAGANRIVASLGSRKAEKAFQHFVARRFPQHLLGTVPVLVSSDVTEDSNLGRSTWTSLLNAFLHPAMERFLYNTDNRLRNMNFRAPLLVFRNDGMAGRVAKTSAIKTYGSGPEGGVRGAEALAKQHGYDHLITIDVGGTTTDFGIVENGKAEIHQFGKLETVQVSFPMSDLLSIGVGGGSIIKVAEGVIKVGPESVGAAPGPACFGFGGTSATITDVKLLKGVIDPNHYFGGRMQLDKGRAIAAVKANVAEPLGIDIDQAIDDMEDAWVGAVAKHLHGYVKPNTVLGAFGGAGPFSICAIAEAVAVKKVIVPAMAAVFSARGIGESDIGHRYDIVIDGALDPEEATARIEAVRERARKDMFAEGFDLDACTLRWTLWDEKDGGKPLDSVNVGNALSTLSKAGPAILDLVASHPIGHNVQAVNGTNASGAPPSKLGRKVRFTAGKNAEVPVYQVSDLRPGMSASGQLIIEDPYFTLPVLDGWQFAVTPAGDIELISK